MEDEFESDYDEKLESDDVEGGTGVLYVMRETDWLTGATNDYFKIGIVKPKGDYTVDKRQKAHQTGNPRNIWTYREWTDVPMVQMLETRIHNAFAQDRVSSGEWFLFPKETISLAIDRIQEMHDEHLEAISNRIASAAHARLRECKEALEPSDLLRELATRYQFATTAKSVHKANRELIRARLIELVGDATGYQHLFKTSEITKVSKFTDSLAQKNYPEIAADYVFYREDARRLSVTVDKDSKEKIVEFKNSLELDESSLNSSDPVALHRMYLDEWALGDEQEWQVDSIKWRIQAIIGEHIGVEGVATWKPGTTKAFRSADFRKDHPDLAANCMTEYPAKRVQNIAEWASYPR